MFPFSGLGLRIASNIIFIKLQLILRSKYKLLILDADNTLWNGIIDEAGYKNINFKNNLLKINYLIFQKIRIKKKVSFFVYAPKMTLSLSEMFSIIIKGK